MPVDTQEMLLEIKQSIAELKTEIKNIMPVVDLKLDKLEEKIKVSNHRIDDLEKQNTWLWRCVAGALIDGVLANFL